MFWGFIFGVVGYSGGLWLLIGDDQDYARLTLGQRLGLANLTLVSGLFGAFITRDKS